MYVCMYVLYVCIVCMYVCMYVCINFVIPYCFLHPVFKETSTINKVMILFIIGKILMGLTK